MKLTFDVPDQCSETIQQLVQQVLEMLQESTKQSQWPQKGDIYYWLNCDGAVYDDVWTDESSDINCRAIGNCFKTWDEAALRSGQLQVIHELEQLADDDQPWNSSACHWYLAYSYIGNSEEIEAISSERIRSNRFYFKSRESAQAAIDKIGKERLMKYYFKIPEEQK